MLFLSFIIMTFLMNRACYSFSVKMMVSFGVLVSLLISELNIIPISSFNLDGLEVAVAVAVAEDADLSKLFS